MPLDDKIRELAVRGELVHLSVAFVGGVYRAVYTSASAAGGYVFGQSADAVEAIEAALAQTPRPPRKRPSAQSPSAETEITAAVTGADQPVESSLPTDWTQP